MGGAYVTGDFSFSAGGTFIVGADTLIPTGLENIFLAKYTCVIPLTDSISSIMPVCNGVCTGSATATPTNGSAPYAFSWNTTPLQVTQTATNLCAGSYIVTITDVATDSIMDTVLITEPPPVIADSSTTTDTIIAGDNIQLTTSALGTFSWNPTLELSCASCPDPIASPIETTKYCITATNTSGCTDSACTIIIVKDYCATVYVPNAFTPENNGLNDVFKPIAGCLHDYKLLIFNRWGEQLFQTTDSKEGWNGYYHGEICQQDVYVYKLFFVDDIKNTIHQYIGNVTLVK
jgi:gliding motility-associated-like protein